MDKRLQFIHHNEIFSGNTTVEAREAAIDFLTNQYFKQVTRPSLYAEPVIVRYENKETPNEPNIILAIGSKGSGSTFPTKDSEYFIIDTQGIKDDVNKKYDEIENAIAKLAFKFIDSDTLHLSESKEETGSTVSGDVKISDNIVINKEFVNNIIKKNKDGIYSYVHLDFDDKTNTFTFQVNEDVDKFSIPVIESGKYDISKECIVLTYTDGKTLDIDVDDLIGEWDTEGESSTTPIVLTKEKHTDKNTDIDDRNSDHWRDILKADVRIADTKKHNILTRVNDGRELYVKGTADNIAYDDEKNVKQAIDAITTEISTAMTNNIIYKDYANNGDYNGIAANVALTYDKATNNLTFSISDTNGVMHSETHKLNSASFIDDISYNTEKQTITIRYKDEDGNVQKADIDLSTLLDDWEVSSEAHNVKLNKQSNPGKKDILTADAKIKAKTDDNYQILEDRDHELYVKGTADNIHYKNGEYVDKALDRTENEITAETKTRIDSDIALSGHVTTIYNTIGHNEFSTDEHETIAYRFHELSAKTDNEISSRESAITSEQNARIATDDFISGAVDAVSGVVSSNSENIGNIYQALGDFYRGNNDEHTVEQNITNRLTRLETSATTTDNRLGLLETSATTASTRITNLTVSANTLFNSANTANTRIGELTTSATTLFNTIGTGFSDDVADKHTITDFKNAVESSASSLNNYANEISASTLHNAQSIEALSAESYFEVGETNSISMRKDSQTSAHTVTAYVKIDDKKPNNILVINPDNNNGLFATISYDESTNELIVSDTSGSTHERRISLKTDKIINSARYDKDTEEIVIEFDTKNIEDSELRIKVGDIIKEWETDNANHNITLERSAHDVSGTDKVYADVNIPTTDNYADNLIANVKLVSGSKTGIYVSGENVRQSATTIADEAATKAKNDAINSAKTYTDKVHTTITGEIDAAKEEAKNSASANTDTKISAYDEKLQRELNLLSSTTKEQAISEAGKNADVKIQAYDKELWSVRLRDLSGATKDAAYAQSSAYTDTAISQHNHTIHDELKDLSAATSADAVAKANRYSDKRNGDLETKAAVSANTAYTNATSYTENAITDVNKEINTEKTAREEAIRNVTELTNAESRRALSAETALSTRINSEADTRHNEDEKLSNSITSATQDLTTKIGNVKDLVTSETNDRQDADRTLQIHINNEQASRIAKDIELSQSISGEVISRENAINAEKTTREQEDTRIAGLINAETSNRENQDTALDNKITAETAARTADTKSLTDKLATEIANAKKYADDQDKSLKIEVEKYADDKDSALKNVVKTYTDDAVAAVTLTGGSTPTAEVTVADKTIKAKVLLSKAVDNIIKSGEGNETGLYAQPGRLTYDSATNKLTFTDENNKSTEITLNSASFIDSISYDESGRTLVITYHTTGEGEGTTQTVNVNLAGLVNKQTVDNTNKTVNITTAVTTDNGVTVTQFSADVNIADKISDNLLTTVKDGGKGSLVVHGQPIYDKISEVSGSSKDNTDKINNIIKTVGLNSDGTKTGDSIQKEIDDIQKAAGLTKDGNYTANTDTTYIQNVTSLTKADEALDKAIKDISDKFSSYSASSSDKSVNLQAELDAAEKAAFGNVEFTSASTYTKHENANYIGDANSLTEADNILDVNLHKVSGDVTTIINNLNGDDGLSKNLEKLRKSTGVNTDYTYTPNSQVPYIGDAENLNNADVKLANTIRTVSGDVTNIKIDIANITDPASGRIKNLQDEIDRIESNSGLDSDGKYINSDKKYISSATTLAEADKALSDAISSVEGKLNNLTKGGKTYTAILSAETDANTGVDLLKANVRLAVANGQDTANLTRTQIPYDNQYEGNLLQVIKAVSEGAQISLDSPVNGLYFGGSIDYGELQGDDNLED